MNGERYNIVMNESNEVSFSSQQNKNYKRKTMLRTHSESRSVRAQIDLEK